MIVYFVAGVAVAEHHSFGVRLFGQVTVDDVLGLERGGRGDGGDGGEGTSDEEVW